MPTRAKSNLNSLGRRDAPARLSLTLQYASACASLPTRPALRRWVKAALRRDAQVTLRLVDATEARALNRKFRGENHATNVLTFVYDVPSQDGSLSGDIVLCASVVEREAREQGKTTQAHYAHLTVHGVLHLQGYDHEHSRAAKKMEQLEIDTLATLGFADPYQNADNARARQTLAALT
jgi:probable rRNA maturation factor